MYREAERIGATVDALARWPSCDTTELIFVDDGSDDGTGEVVEQRAREARLPYVLLRQPANRGKGAAVRAGMLAATGQYVAFADADLSAGLDEIDRCFDLIEGGEIDVVFATRASVRSDIVVHQPALRQLSGKAFNAVTRLLGLTSFSDTQCGLKVFRREVARALFEPLITEGFAFDVELLLRAQALGLMLKEVPIEWRHVDASRVAFATDSLQMLRDVVRLRRRVGRAARPITEDTLRHSTFDVMSELEREHWWFRAKRDLVREAIGRAHPGAGAALDVGCGTGETVSMLAAAGFAPAVGADLSEYALALCQKVRHEGTSFVASSADALSVGDGRARVVTSLDVLEHLDSDVAALREYARATGPSGVIVATVPAYAWAWSEHDVNLGHRRRYRRAQLLAAAREAGLEPVQCTYFHMWLVPIAVLIRRTPLRHLVRAEPEATSFVNSGVNRLLFALTAVERRLARRVSLPFGLSILLVARVSDHLADAS